MTTISRSRPSERHKPRNQPAPAARFVVRRHWPFHRRVPFRRGWSWHLLSSDHPNDLVFDYSGACRRPGWALTWVGAVAGLTRQAKRRHARRPESSDALRVVVEMQAGAVAGHGKGATAAKFEATKTMGTAWRWRSISEDDWHGRLRHRDLRHLDPPARGWAATRSMAVAACRAACRDRGIDWTIVEMRSGPPLAGRLLSASGPNRRLAPAPG